MSAACCGLCKYSVLLESETPSEEQQVECHRYAPQKLHGVGTGYEKDKWPVLEAGDFCGDFVHVYLAEFLK